MSNPDHEPVFVRGGRDRPIIATAAHEKLRATLKKGGNDQTTIACDAVKVQLALWEEELRKRAVAPSYEILGVDLAGMEFEGVFGENLERDVGVVYGVAEKAGDAELGERIWSWFKLPFSVRCAGRDFVAGKKKEVEGKGEGPRKKAKVEGHEELVDDVDEWVLRNEVFLRTLSKLSLPPINALDSWSFGLVRLADLRTTIPSSSSLSDVSGSMYALKIPRAPIDTIPGYSMLHAKRASEIYVQPNVTSFKSRFESMTDGILTGLDWHNIFVAGGLVLGSLLTPEVPPATSLDKPSNWISSDIDMYIYGLPLDKANEKIHHIADVYKKNLPHGVPFLVVRNSQTITLYSEWPRRRVQIVLKLVKSPREVLLNFDLDICAVGWDGKEVWMLPRFVRALETGTNVFTMDLVNGHYLGDRKATRDKRVFKYADRGYGLRIIPLYLSYLTSYQPSSTTTTTNPRNRPPARPIARGQPLYPAPLSLPNLAQSARSWTEKVMNKYIAAWRKHPNKDRLLFHWPRGRWPKIHPEEGSKPIFSHAMLESYAQITCEPLGRSCLTGFSLLMRHVALWEVECEGRIEIYRHIFAEDAYNNIGEVAYDDTPMYEWDSTFTISKFKTSIDEFNEREWKATKENLEGMLEQTYRWDDTAKRDEYRKVIKDIPNRFGLARVTYAESVEEVLGAGKDIVIMLATSEEFVKFANRLIGEGRIAAGFDEKRKVGGPLEIVKVKHAEYSEGLDEVMVVWRLDSVLNWQMLDRRIDEIREALWAFHRANERAHIHPDEGFADLMRTQISKRAIRISEEDEVNGFVRWVGRQPYHEDTSVNGIAETWIGFEEVDKYGFRLDDEDEEDDDE